MGALRTIPRVLAITCLMVTLALSLAPPANAQGVGAWLTAPGEAAGRLLADALSDAPDFVVAIDKVSVRGLSAFTLEGVTFSDADGVWARAPSMRISWHPRALLDKRVHLEDLQMGTLEIIRAPAGSTEPGADNALLVLAWPAPGVDIRIDALKADIVSENPDGDEGSALSLRGDFELAAGVLKARLDATGAGDEHLRAAADISEARNEIGVSLDVRTPAGSALGRLLGLGGQGGGLVLEGTGPPEEWTGRLDLTLDQGDRVSGTLARAPTESGDGEESVGGRLRFVLDGKARLTAAGLALADVPEDLGQGLAGDYSARGGLVFDGAALEDAALTLESPRLDAMLGHRPAEAADRLALRVALRDPDVLAAAVGGFTFSRALIDGAFTLTAPTRFAGDVAFIDFASGDVTASEIAGRVDVNFADASIGGAQGTTAISFVGDGRVLGMSLPGAGQPLAPGALTWSAAGVWADGATEITLNRFRLSGAALEARGRVSLATGGGPSRVVGSLRLDDLSLVRPELSAGRYEGAFTLRDGAAGFELSFDGRITDVRSDVAILGQLITAGDLSLRFSQPAVTAGPVPPGALDMALATDAMAIDFKAAFADDGTLDADLEGVVTDARAARDAFGVEIARESRFSLALNGPGDNPDLVVRADMPSVGGAAGLRDARLRARLTNMVRAPAGAITLTGDMALGQFDARTRVESPSAGEIALVDLGVTTPLAEITGGLVLDRESGVVTGDIKGASEDIAAVQEALAFEGTGEFSFDLALGGADGRQQIDLDVNGRNVSTVLADRQAITVAGLGLRARVELPGGIATLAEPEELTLESRLTRLHGGALTFEEVTVSANGEAGRFPFDIQATGDFFGPIDVTSGGSVSFKGAGYEVVIDRLGGLISNRALKLAEPVTYRRAPGRRVMTPMQLAYGKGRIDLAYDANPENQRLRLEIEETDAGLVPLFLPIPPITGALDVQLLLEVAGGEASGYAALAAREIQPLDPARKGLDQNFPVEAALSIDLSENSLTVVGRGDSPSLDTDLSAAIPVRVFPDRARMTFDRTTAIEGELSWNGLLAPLMAILPPLDHAFAGDLEGGIRVTGSIDAPSLDGRFALANGSYESFAFGSRLEDITGVLRFDGQRVELAELSGTDQAGGRLSGAGAFELDGARHYPGRLDLTLDTLRPLALDSASAVASGTLAYVRTPERFTLEGALETRSVELRLAEQLPTEITTLEVIEINGNGNGAQPRAPANGEAPALNASVRPLLESLDVKVDAPARIYLRGRGLDSEWGGGLSVGGTPVRPRVQGSLDLIRGTFAFAGRQIDLKSGRLQFTGGDNIDPHIELVGVYDTVSLTAEIQLIGPLSAPRVTLSSSPAMPEDEIMARILFGTSVHELSAVEAVQLAAAVSSLSGGGGLDVFSRARSLLGLDRLTVENDDQETGGRLVTGGKYLSNNIYLEVQTRTDTGESNAAVRVDLTRNLQVESDVGSDNSSSIGLQWKKDY